MTARTAHQLSSKFNILCAAYKRNANEIGAKFYRKSNIFSILFGQSISRQSSTPAIDALIVQ